MSRPRTGVRVLAENKVSSAEFTIPVEVLYYINNIELVADVTLTNTETAVAFYLILTDTANFPMHMVNITIDYQHGIPVKDQTYLNDRASNPTFSSYTHLFNIQGVYTVTAVLQNVLGSFKRTITMNVWDSMSELDFISLHNTYKYITNTTAVFKFIGAPVYGFKYTIDYGDGTTPDSNTTDEIMYAHYDLEPFSHVFTKAGTYTLRWISQNNHPPYNRDQTFSVLIQNPVPRVGYTLEPNMKRYPWLNLQTRDISVNITLNASTHVPTDATCIFYPGDGEPSVPDLVFDDIFFEHKHRFLNEGIFNMSFNCSNEVSSFMYKYQIEVMKFEASFLWVDYHPLVPLNVSDTVDVYFHVQTGGFALIPDNVFLTWNFGEPIPKRKRRAPQLLDRATYVNKYFERGDYIVNLFVDARTTNTTTYFQYPLRVGIMHFEYQDNISYLNYTNMTYTMYGELGSFHTFEIDFDDTSPNARCHATNYSGCSIVHQCPQWGYHLVQVKASNGTFIEIDNMNMTCENPIVNLTTDIPSNVSIPNGFINALLRIPPPPVLYLPVLTCTWNMGDPILRNNYQFTQSVSHNKPFVFENGFHYIGLGRHTITIDCWNLINRTSFQQFIVVESDDYLFLGVFDRIYSQIEDPMLISSMIDTEVFSRLNIIPSYTDKTHVNKWAIIPNEPLVELNTNRQGFIFSRGMLPSNIYKLQLNISFIEEPSNVIFEPTFIRLVIPPPHAEIVGGSRRLSPRTTITLDAYSVSFDPAYPYSDILIYTWQCKT